MSHHMSRDRSRDRQGYRGRSQSPPDSNQKKKRTHHRTPIQTSQKPQPKRVKFNDIPDIKLFRKDDQPNCKGLTDAELEEYMKKIQAEKGANSFNNQNWEKVKHIDALLESHSIKEQKQKQKILNEKLQGVKEEIPYYSPPILKSKGIAVLGEGSKQKVELSNRLNDVLACFYVHESQIPAQPSFQIQNKSTSHQPKHINFDKQRIDNKDLNTTKKKQKDQKPLKGILKMSPQDRVRQRSQSAPPKVDPYLIKLLMQLQINKEAYSKQKIDTLLKPYKDSGELDYLLKNHDILKSMMKNSSAQMQPQKAPIMNQNIKPIQDPYKPRYSISPQPERRQISPIGYQPPGAINPEMNKQQGISQYGQYNQQPPYNNYGQYNPYPNYQQRPPAYNPTPQAHNPSMMGVYNTPNPPPIYPPQQPPNPYPNYGQQNNPQQMYMVNRNFRTVPCKYFHSPQGCVKAGNCTFIHEQEYAGKPSPSMLKSNRGMVMTNYNPAQNDSNAQMGNFYPQYPNDGYQGQN